MIYLSLSVSITICIIGGGINIDIGDSCVANSSTVTTPPTQTHSLPLPRAVGSQKIPPSSSISDSFSLDGVMVFAVLGNGFDRWGGGGGGGGNGFGIWV